MGKVKGDKVPFFISTYDIYNTHTEAFRGRDRR